MAKRSSLDTEYRRINDRMQRLFEAYGMDNPTYQQYASEVQANFEYNTLPDGRVQIKQGKANANPDLFQRRVLNDMLKGDTYGTLRKEARQYAKEHGYGKSKDLDEMVEKMEYVKANRDLISWISTQIKAGANLTDNLKKLYKKAAGRSDELTYDDLYELMTQALPDRELYE